LHGVADGYVPPPPRVYALFETGIVEAAKVSKHLGKRGGLRFVWLNPIFVGEHRHATRIYRCG
jgi:hypothetical protein